MGGLQDTFGGGDKVCGGYMGVPCGEVSEWDGRILARIFALM